MSTHHTTVWESCLNIIRDNISSQAFKVWFEPIVPTKLENNVLTIQVPSHFFYEWLEQHYIHLLKKVIKKEIGPDATLEYSIVIENNSSQSTPYTVKLPTQNTSNLQNPSQSIPIQVAEPQIRNPFIIPGLKKVTIASNLIPSHTFENFVEGECNRLARASGYAVANKPG
ncbi:MAG: DnaA N-terminal domain-containing protein, partial [Bacteroidota bacterium]